MDVRAALAECGKDQQGLVRVADLRSAGVTRSTLSRALAKGDVVRVRPAVYALVSLLPWPVFVVTHEGVAAEFVQHVRAVLLSLGDRVTVAGPTAACLRGWGLLHEPLRCVDLAVPTGRSRIRVGGVRTVQRCRVAREALEVRADEPALWVTSATTTVLDCCAQLPLLDAVVVCDSALRSRQVTLSQLRQAAARLRGVRHAYRMRRVLELCDPDSGSVLESVLRFLMVQDGIEGFVTQRVLRDTQGHYLLRVDFCFAAARLVIETDGARWHPEPSRDQRLDNRLVATGWRVLRFTWAEVVHDPEPVLELIRCAVTGGTHDIASAAAGVPTAA
ncbi:MAG: type IV toxin-antitoxin system AbiEi family antitoxin domain-containing protein [Mycobacteriales bacterium]